MNKQNNHFQHLVLKALWLILFYIAKNPSTQLNRIRQDFIDFGDLYGVQGDEAKKFVAKLLIGITKCNLGNIKKKDFKPYGPISCITREIPFSRGHVVQANL